MSVRDVHLQQAVGLEVLEVDLERLLGEQMDGIATPLKASRIKTSKF
jgi:hypothetical protein